MITNRITSASFGVREITKFLKDNGIPVKRTTAMSEDEDASVEVNDKIHIQVGYGYMIVNYWTDKNKNAMMMGAPRQSLADVLKDVKKALKK